MQYMRSNYSTLRLYKPHSIHDMVHKCDLQNVGNIEMDKLSDTQKYLATYNSLQYICMCFQLTQIHLGKKYKRMDYLNSKHMEPNTICMSRYKHEIQLCKSHRFQDLNKSSNNLLM
jgi:hypothetical protein